MTPKRLLEFKVNGFSTLRDILSLYKSERQFPECSGMTEEQTNEYFERLAQKIIWAAGREE